jgi:heme-degrading monooxygenase HmoA
LLVERVSPLGKRDRKKRRIREMAKIGQPYTSGAWLVRAGSEEAFIERWTNFTQWSLKNAPGAESFVLLRDITERRRFVSFGAWDDPEAVVVWRQRPEFSELLGECRALCEEFEPHVYTLAASPSR